MPYFNEHSLEMVIMELFGTAFSDSDEALAVIYKTIKVRSCEP